MLLGWLNGTRPRSRPTPRPSPSSPSTPLHVAEIEVFCARWRMRVTRFGGGAKWQAVRVDGPRLPVIGFAQITTMYR